MRLVYITLGWVAGILLAASTDSLSLIIWIVFAALCGIALFFARWDKRWLMVFAVLLACALGGLRFSLVPISSDVAAYNNRGGLTIEGVVVDEPDVRDDRVQLQLDAETVTRIGETVPTSGTVLVQAPRFVDVRYGDRVTATGLLITPAEYDTFSYSDYLARSGVFSIMKNGSVEVISTGHGTPLFSVLLDIKRRAHEAISNNLPEPQAGLLSGILLGNERGIDPKMRDDFNAVGASHIIAISGFNMVIISGVVMGILNRLHREWLAAFLGIGIIGLYTVLVGANTAVVRAAIMSGLLVVAPLLKRRTYVPASLVFVLLLMSFENPTVLWDVSFQLSFLAVLGLALYADPFSNWFNQLLQRIFPRRTAGVVGNLLNEPLVVTLAAQVFTLPLIVLYFNRLSLVAIIVNMFIIPAQTALLIVGGLATIIALFAPGLAVAFYWFDLLFLSWSIFVVRLFAELPFADVEFGVDSRLITLYFVILIGGAMLHATRPPWSLRLAHLIRRRSVLFATVFSGLAFVVLVVAVLMSRPDGRLHVWLLDVGHSNAVLVQSPGGAHMLVDGGRFPSRLLTAVGDRLPFYDREIEVLAITHPDEFDIAALNAVVARYDVGITLTHGQPNQGDVFLGLQDALAQYELVAVRAGYTLDFDDGVHVEVLHPQEQPELVEGFNENMLVLRLSYGDVSFLLTSDLNQDGQAVLLEAGQWPLASVMQLPQHGTVDALAEDFLTAVQPQVVILQNDRANRRGDPDGDTLSLIADIPLFRTDEGGTVHLWTDGSELWAVQEG